MRRAKTSTPENSSCIEVRVLYADTDRMGVVYHATYLRFFEAGRAHFMRARGKTYAALEAEGVQLPVVEAGLVYMKPALYDEVVEVVAWVAELGRAQVRFEYLVTRDGVPLVSGFTRHAAIRPGGGPTRLPEDVKTALTRPALAAEQTTTSRRH